MKIPKVRMLFILSGIILTVACILLSRTDCIKYTSFNSWSLETTIEYAGFAPNCFLLFGIIEIALLASQKRRLRRMAILVSLLNLIFPWLIFFLNNKVGLSFSDASYHYSVNNPIPYLITALATLLFIQEIVTFIFLYPKRKNITA